MKITLLSLLVLCLASCAHQKETTTSEAKLSLQNTYEKRIGSATKADLVQDFGNPQWCRPQDTGYETCRFYRSEGTQWMGSKTDRTHYEKYDEVMADFDSTGTLRAFKASAQR